MNKILWLLVGYFQPSEGTEPESNKAGYCARGCSKGMLWKEKTEEKGFPVQVALMMGLKCRRDHARLAGRMAFLPEGIPCAEAPRHTEEITCREVSPDCR